MLRVLFVIGLASCSPLWADYGEQPLRGALSDRPHFQTSLGRENHRFEKHLNNAYQLYDFYARQAQYYLSGVAEAKPLLLPYPGLEGGRRGHWGYTNEKNSTAYHREKGPQFTVLTGRDNGRQYVRSGTAEHPAICVFNFQTPRLERVMVDGRLEAPGHAFTYKVDRFGMNMHAHGTAYLHGPKRDWQGPIRYKGYYLNGNRVIYRYTLGESRLDGLQLLSSGWPVTVSGEWVGRPELAKAHVNDDNLSSIWAGPEHSRNGWVQIDLGRAADISAVEVDEGPYPRTRSYEIRAKVGEQWKLLAKGATIGKRKHIAFPSVYARLFRIDILKAIDVPVLSEFQLYGQTGPGGKPQTCDVLDTPRLHYVDGVAVFSRQIEFLGDAEHLQFNLPTPVAAKVGTEIKVSHRNGPRRRCMVLKGATHSVIHQVQLPSGEDPDTVALKAPPNTRNAHVEIRAASVGQRLHISTWVIANGSTDIIDKLASNDAALSALIGGGESRFPQTVTMAGTVDADPALSGSAYAIDDIPVPVKNPYDVSMTLCGLAFDRKGVAYVTTLVGDVWRVTGIGGGLKEVTWKRFAAGLNLPLGIEIVNDLPYVLTKDQIVILRDLNGDHEADFYARFNRGALPDEGKNRQELQRDAAGRFYYNSNSGMYRVAADGSKAERIGGGARNPLGLGVRADGLALSDSSEGNVHNGTCTIFESNHSENVESAAKRKRILYLPRGFDNSPGSRLFLDEPRFGPLGNGIVGVSYGSGRMYALLRDANEGTPQAAVVGLPGNFSSGSARLCVNPMDGQLYTAGFDAWGDYAVEEGSLSRIRHTGLPAIFATGWKAYANGILVIFDKEVAATSSAHFFSQQWTYVDSQNTYGSPEYSVKDPTRIGHDHLVIKSVRVLEDKRSLFFAIPELRPAMCTQIYGKVKALDGSTLTLNLIGTINKLRDHHPSAAPAAEKPMALVVPERTNNGNTYQNIVIFFDKAAGRAGVKRPVVPAVAYKKTDLNYAWINTHLVQKQCILCHAKGMPHDYTSYEGLKTKINLQTPHKSHLHGMLTTDSMPPYPLPTVAPEMKRAVMEWIKMGAPEK
jgi:hypothetical protein